MELPFSERAKGFVARVAKGDSSTAYNQWAPSYDADVDSMNYSGYRSVVEKWLAYHHVELTDRSNKHKLFDAGCGTGLIGEQLAKSPAKDYIEIYGGDISSEMLIKAGSKGVYKHLQVVNLKEELPYECDSFDSVVCAGVFGIGHCGPECVVNIVRVLKPGGYFIATVNQELFDASTATEWKRQILQCNCELIEEVEMPYRDYATAFVLTIRKECAN